MHVLFSRLTALLLGRRLDTEFDRELESHLAMLTDKFVRQGMTPQEASYAARRQFGGIAQVKQDRYETRSLPQVETFFQDVRYAVRTLLKTPRFTIAVLATLALGIGANTAIFSVVNTVLLKPLAYPEPDRIVQFLLTSLRFSPAGYASIPTFRLWSEQADIFQDVSGYDFGGSRLNVTGGDQPEQIGGIHVTASYFRLFGVPVELGRSFSSDEDIPNGPHLVVISDGLWRRRYGADPQAVGKAILLGGESYTIVGIVGPQFEFDQSPDVWIPFQLDLNSTSQALYFVAAGRLKPGITLPVANARLKLTADEYRRRFPGSPTVGPQNGFSVQPLQETIVTDARLSLLILMAAVGLVLVIACSNVGNLLLVRAASRRREIAIRAAVGASRWRIVRQLLIESIVLSLAGGSFGLALGTIAVHALLAINPADIPRIGRFGAAVTLDWRVFLFTAVISLGTGILFGLIPALRTSRLDLAGRGSHQDKTSSLLVISEVSLAIVLLIGAALLIRTLVSLRRVEPGFDANNVLTMPMSLSGPRLQAAAGVAQLAVSGIEALEALPGVEAAAMTHRLPLEGAFNTRVTIPGQPPANAPSTAGWNSVSPHYFEILRIPLVRGRFFTVRDGATSARVVIVNEAFRKQFWGERDPIGGRLVIGNGGGPEFEEPARQIVGVVGDVHERGLGAAPRPNVYIPISQMKDGMAAQISRTGPVVWIVRTRSDPRVLSSPIQKELRRATGLPVTDVRTMDDVVARSTAPQAFDTILMTIFGCSALLLAAIGIYGMIAYSVQQRTHEFGIRMALGAQASRLRNSILFLGLRVTIAGVLCGTVAAFALARWMAFLLWGIKPWDPIAFIAVPAILSAVALAAIWIPALRATRVDPMIALRHD